MNTAYVFMGYPGCGKSSLAIHMVKKDNDLYLSSDNLRVELYGFRDQTHNKEVFETLFDRAIKHADIGDVYIDATNLTVRDRLRGIGHLKGRYNLHLIFVIRSIDEILEVNEYRKTNIPESAIPDNIIKKALGRFQLPTYDEGWDNIQYYFVTNKFSPLESYLDYHSLEDMAHDNPHHSETIKQHLDYLTKYCKENKKGDILTRIASAHDVGKFYTKQYVEEKGFSQFIGHAAVSSYIFLLNNLINYMYKNCISSGFVNNVDEFLKTDNLMIIFLAIYYHDLSYNLPNKEDLIENLKKQNKNVSYLLKKYCKGYKVEDFADILFQFHDIDELREF